VSRPPGVVSAAPRLAAKAQAQRRDRRKARLRRATWVSAAALPLLLVGWVLLFSSLLSVHRVTVAGESRLTAAQVEAAAAVAPGTPLARVDTAAVARRVEALQPVARVTVTRRWPSTLVITLVERVPVVAVPRTGSYLLLDLKGVAVATARAVPRGAYRLEVADPGKGDPATRAALVVLRGLPRTLLLQLGALRAPSPEEVTLVLRDGRQVLWGGSDNTQGKVAAVLALIRMPGHVYDVSAPGVVTRR
jgi:cell division protein FtsQ